MRKHIAQRNLRNIKAELEERATQPGSSGEYWRGVLAASNGSTRKPSERVRHYSDILARPHLVNAK